MPDGITQASDSNSEQSIDFLARSVDGSAVEMERAALPASVLECARLILGGIKDGIVDSQTTEAPLKVVEQAQELGRVFRKENYQLRDVYQATVWLRKSAGRMVFDDIDRGSRSLDELERRVERWFDDVAFAALNAYYEAQRHDLQKRIVIDGLTGVFNRTYLGERLAEEIERGRRYSHAVTLLMVDVDSMKPVNDRFGHRAGDAVLKSVSRVLRVQSRSVDVVARYGGDEFAVIMPQTGPEGAWSLAERITRGVRESQPEELRDVVSVSVGMASFPRDADTAEGLVDAADKALYRAKSEGGNAIAAFSSKVVADLGGRPRIRRDSSVTVASPGPRAPLPSGDASKTWMDRARRLERQNLELTVSLGLARKKLAFYEKLEGDLQQVLDETLRSATDARLIGDARDQQTLDEMEEARMKLMRDLDQLRAEQERMRASLLREKADTERQLAALRAEVDRLMAEERQSQVRRMELIDEIASLTRQRDQARAQIETVLRQIGGLPSSLEGSSESTPEG